MRSLKSIDSNTHTNRRNGCVRCILIAIETDRSRNSMESLRDDLEEAAARMGGSDHGHDSDQQQQQAADPHSPTRATVHDTDTDDDDTQTAQLLPAHHIVSDIPASPSSPTTGADDDDEDGTGGPAGGMIDSSDFRAVLSEPTYQTLNGRMTPPGFATSSSYATLTPLQPLPPISTMSDKFSHYGHHHPTGGGFALMQTPAGLSMAGVTSYHQYDKLGSAMAAAGMNMSVSLAVNNSGSGGNVIVSGGGGHNQGQGHQQSGISSNGQNHHVHHSSHIIHSSSSPFHSNSPDKSLSPTNGFEYSGSSGGHRVLGSPASQSPVNLHSPTSLLPALNGLPASPPAQMPPSPASVSPSNGHHPQSQQQHGTFVSSPQESKVIASVSPQQVTVLQTAVTSCLSGAQMVPNAQTVTIVQAPVSNLAATIVSTPVAVVTTASALHQQQQQQQHLQQQSLQSQQQSGTQTKTAAGIQKNCANSHSSQSDSSAASGDELEEINTKDLAQRISSELKRYSIPQAIFAQRVLCRSQGTLSDLLRNPKPWSKLKSGRETFRRMSKWLEEPEFQRMSALRLAGQFFIHTSLIPFGFLMHLYYFRLSLKFFFI